MRRYVSLININSSVIYQERKENDHHFTSQKGQASEKTQKDLLFLFIDPLGRPTVTTGSDHCFHTCRASVPTFQNLAKTQQI